jgi:chromosome segregation ATPase
MADDMTSIPPRVNEVEKEVHTLRHRIAVIEETHKDTPHRLTKLEQVAEDMPRIRQELREQGEMIRKGFTLTNGMLYGAAAMWFLFQAGPQLLKFLGGS